MELGDLNDDSDQDPAVKDFLGKIDPELFNDDKGGIISEDIFNLVHFSKKRTKSMSLHFYLYVEKISYMLLHSSWNRDWRVCLLEMYL